MPTDIQFKDELRKEKIRIEDELELLRNKEYEKLEKRLERDLKRINDSLQDTLIDKYIDLQRIKKSEDKEKELDYQLRVTKAKLESFGIITTELELE